jgi:uncharacterized protein YkwD
MLSQRPAQVFRLGSPLPGMPRFLRRSGTVLSTAVLLAVVAVTGAGAADVPPLPPLEPLPSLLGGDPPQQSSAQSGSAAAASAAPARSQTATATSVAAELQRLVAAQIDAVRHSYGRSRLTLSTQLTRAGQEHARQLALAGFFSHDWPDGTPFGHWIRRFYPVGSARTWRAGENLAWSVQDVTAQQAVELWLASPEHRRILLDTRWRQVGLGVIRADGAGGVYGGQSVVILAAEFGVRR